LQLSCRSMWGPNIPAHEPMLCWVSKAL
jgi:hypothetical protein